jgi:DnaJ-class molecular chaperone
MKPEYRAGDLPHLEQYESECRTCGGTGTYYMPPEQPYPETCHICGGIGMVLTDEGRALIAFLTRHGAMFSDQITGEDAEAAYNIALDLDAARRGE